MTLNMTLYVPWVHPPLLPCTHSWVGQQVTLGGGEDIEASRPLYTSSTLSQDPVYGLLEYYRGPRTLYMASWSTTRTSRTLYMASWSTTRYPGPCI